MRWLSTENVQGSKLLVGSQAGEKAEPAEGSTITLSSLAWREEARGYEALPPFPWQVLGDCSYVDQRKEKQGALSPLWQRSGESHELVW